MRGPDMSRNFTAFSYMHTMTHAGVTLIRDYLPDFLNCQMHKHLCLRLFQLRRYRSLADDIRQI